MLEAGFPGLRPEPDTCADVAIFTVGRMGAGQTANVGQLLDTQVGSLRKSLELSAPVRSGVVSSFPGRLAFLFSFLPAKETPGQLPFLSLQ